MKKNDKRKTKYFSQCRYFIFRGYDINEQYWILNRMKEHFKSNIT